MHPCARCASLQKTCCQRAQILVTAGDRARIARHTGLDPDDFAYRRPPDDPDYAQPDPDDPDWHRLVFAPDGTRPVLRRRPDGDCTFLGPQGCSLPTEVRPLVCRLYPYDYTADALRGVADGYCPTQALLPKDDPGVTMLTVLRMDPRDAERWRRTLYHELRTGTERDADRPDLRPA